MKSTRPLRLRRGTFAPHSDAPSATVPRRRAAEVYHAAPVHGSPFVAQRPPPVDFFLLWSVGRTVRRERAHERAGPAVAPRPSVIRAPGAPSTSLPLRRAAMHERSAEQLATSFFEGVTHSC